MRTAFSIFSKENAGKLVGTVIALLFLFGLSEFAHAGKKYFFNLPAQPMVKSLNQLSEQTDTLALFPYDLVKNCTGNSVVGHFDMQQAVEKLLRGSGLAAEFPKEGVLVVSLAKPDDGENLMSNKKSLLAVLIGLISGVGASSSVVAQDGGSATGKAPLAIEEVVVTAEKRAESLQDVSIAVTAITGDSLRDQGIIGVEDLSTLAPNLLVAENGGNIEVALRGIVTTNFVESGDPATAFHVDGVYYSRPSSLAGTFYDIERVEVLRGPQGTLYGRNANAGNINVITNKPIYELDAEVEVGAGNYSEKTFYGMVNIPISDTLATRFAVNYLNSDGYIDEAFISDNPGQLDDIAFRAHVLWEPTAATSLLVSADYWKTEGYPTTAVPISTGVVATGEPELERFSTVAPDVENELWGVNAELNVDFEGFTLTSITAYRENNRNSYTDADGRVDENGVDTEQRINAIDNTQDQFSEEIRLASNSDGDIEWLLGAYYLEEHQNIYASFGSLIAPGLGLTFPQPDTNAKSSSVFGQGTYHLTDTTRLIAGLRYTDEQKDRIGGTYLTFGLDPKDPGYVAEGVLLSENVADVSWTKTTWKLGAEWDVAEDSMVYLSVGTGFKAGGYFDGVQSESFDVSYDPEEILAWSLGAKNTFMDNRVQLNVEAFLYDYEGYQVSFVDPIPPFGGARGLVTYNADEAEVYGAEAELIYLVSETDMVTGSLSVLNTEFTDFLITRNVDETDPGAEPSEENASGKKLPKAPEITASLAYSHTWPLANGDEITGRISANYTDEYFLFYDNMPEDMQDAYVKADLSASYKPVDDGWYVRAYVNNITDERVCTAGSTGDLDAGECFANKPRTYGFKVGVNF